MEYIIPIIIIVGYLFYRWCLYCLEYKTKQYESEIKSLQNQQQLTIHITLYIRKYYDEAQKIADVSCKGIKEVKNYKSN